MALLADGCAEVGASLGESWAIRVGDMMIASLFTSNRAMSAMAAKPAAKVVAKANRQRRVRWRTARAANCA
jgi:hypothetical protein